MTSDSSIRFAVMDVMANYALAADSKDYGTMRSLFFDDAKIEMEFDDAFLQGQGVSFGDPGSFIEFVEETAAVYRSSQHLLGNPLVSVDDEQVRLRLNLTATAFYEDAGSAETRLYGFYEVALKQLGNEWKIQTLKFTSIGSK